MKKWILSLLLGVVSLQAAPSTPPNTTITNIVNVGYSVDNGGNISNLELSASNSITTVAQIAPQIEIGMVSQASTSDVLSQGSCYINGVLTHQGSPVVSGNKINTPTSVAFSDQNLFSGDNSLFIKVSDSSKNINPGTIDNITVQIQTDSGDVEKIQLNETGINTGIFIGYIGLSTSSGQSGDCILNVKQNEHFSVTYLDGQNNLLSSSGRVDPTETVFDSKTGTPLNGAIVTLYNSMTNQPAVVLGDDGKSIYPSSMTTGTTVKDSSGQMYVFDTGQFRFPTVANGSYYLKVAAPNGYSFASKIDDSVLQTQFSQYNIATGSKGQYFSINSNPILIDIPLDARTGSLSLSKAVSQTSAAIGDFVQYSVTIQNTDKNSYSNVILHDILPTGFRLQAKSLKLNNQIIYPLVNKGSSFDVSIGDIGANQSQTLTYVVEISVGASLGIATNHAMVESGNNKSNDATASLTVNDDLMMNKAIIVGTVFSTKDCKEFQRVPNVKIQFETGHYVLSDSDGNWHMDLLQPQTHVARVDETTIPKGYKPALCENNNRFAGVANSQFIKSTPGSISRADFYLLGSAALSIHLSEPAQNNGVVRDEKSIEEIIKNSLKISSVPTAEKKEIAKQNAGTEALSLNDNFMLNATQESKFLFPEDKFIPSVPAIGVAFEHSKLLKPLLYVNEKKVDDIYFDGIRQSSNGEVLITYWRSVPLNEGKNTLEVKLQNAQGNIEKIISKNIIYSNTINQAIFVPQKSKLLADGINPIEVAVKFLDEFGRPAHKGLIGSYEIGGAFTPFVDRKDGLPIEMLNSGKREYVIGDDGIAIIKLNATTQTGEATLRFKLKERTALIRPWISPAPRDWIMVGIGEGQWSKTKIKPISNNNEMEVIQSDNDRIAFYAKGTITGQYLLTLAYDNKKQNYDPNSLQNLSSINQQVYSVYSDSSLDMQDAQSNKKLYVKIEKEKFYALFGDYQTNLTVTDLTHYDRLLTGVKSEYKGEKISSNIFASKTPTVSQRQEIPGDGTTGFYHASSKIEPYTEVVTIVIRDKNQRDSILSQKVLTRFVDYDIDYDLGTVQLKVPVPSYDIYFNPEFVRLEYSTFDNSGEHTIIGARVAYKINENVEVGLTHVQDKGNSSKQDMSGLDVQVESEKLKIKSEVANSDQQSIDGDKSAKAYSMDAQYQDSWGNIHAFGKKVAPNFGMTDALPADLGLEKIGLEGQWKINDSLTWKSQAIHEKEILTNKTQTTLDNRLEKKFNDQFSGYVGLKDVRVNGQTGFNEGTDISQLPTTTVSSPTPLDPEAGNLLTFGGQYTWKNIPLRLTEQTELNPHKSDTIPTKVRLGAEYDLNSNYTLVEDNEFIGYKSGSIAINRLGLKTKPWLGAKLQSFIGQSNNDNMFTQIGYDQNIPLGNWMIDTSLNRQKWNHQIDPSKLQAGTILSYEDYTSYEIATTYRKNNFTYQDRLELRTSDGERKYRIENNIYEKLSDGWAVSLLQDYEKINSTLIAQPDTLTSHLQGGYSWRDPKNKYTLLGKLDFVTQNSGSQKSSKWIYNNHFDYKPDEQWETMFHVADKYVVSTYDSQEYLGNSIVVNAGVRNFFSPKWNWEVNALAGYSGNSKISTQGLAAGLGYRVIDNAVVTLGYQKMKDYDHNFAFDESYVKGVFIKIDFKFDEKSFHMSKTNNMTFH